MAIRSNTATGWLPAAASSSDQESILLIGKSIPNLQGYAISGVSSDTVMNKSVSSNAPHVGIKFGKISLHAWVALGALALGVSVMPALAIDGTWAVTSGTASWATPASWVSGTAAGGAGSTVNLTAGSGSEKIVTLDGDRTVGILNLGNAGTYRINSGTGGSLIFDNSGSNAQLNFIGTYPLVISALATLNSSLDINSNGSTNLKYFAGGVTASGTGNKVMTFSGSGTGALTIGGKLSDGGGATLSLRQDSGSGGISLTGANANSFSGGVQVSSGTLLAYNSDAKVFGLGTIDLNGGTLRIWQFVDYNFGNSTLVSKNSSIIIGRSSGPTPAITHTLGTLNIGNNILTVNNAGSLTTTSEDTLVFGATTLTGDATFSVQQAAAVNTRLKLGALNGTFNLTKTGNGAIDFSAAAGTYSGTTTLNAGTMIVGNNAALGTGKVVVSGTGVATLQIGTGITTGNNIVYSNTNAASAIQRVVSGSSAFNVGTTTTLTSEFTGGTDNTTASLRAGNSSTTLTMSFAPTSAASNDGDRISDVFNLSLTGSPTYVLQLTTGLVGSDPLYLGWLDGGSWVEATTGNSGTPGSFAGPHAMTWDAFVSANGAFDAATMLGAYGYDASTSTAWAVLDHNSEYALVVPEPSTTLLMGLGIGLTLFRLRSRRS